MGRGAVRRHLRKRTDVSSAMAAPAEAATAGMAPRRPLVTSGAKVSVCRIRRAAMREKGVFAVETLIWL